MWWPHHLGPHHSHRGLREAQERAFYCLCLAMTCIASAQLHLLKQDTRHSWNV